MPTTYEQLDKEYRNILYELEQRLKQLECVTKERDEAQAACAVATSGKNKCHVCGAKTDFACSDCRIDLNAIVYVCDQKDCRDAHAKKCPHEIIEERDKLRAKCAEYEKQISVQADHIGKIEDALGDGLCVMQAVEAITQLKAKCAEMQGALQQFKDGHPLMMVSRDHALSTDCGKGLFSVAELDETIKFLTWLDAYFTASDTHERERLKKKSTQERARLIALREKIK